MNGKRAERSGSKHKTYANDSRQSEIEEEKSTNNPRLQRHVILNKLHEESKLLRT